MKKNGPRRYVPGGSRSTGGSTVKKIINAIPDIVTEMLDGVVAAHPETLRRLEGWNVIVRREIRPGKVTLLSGGGSGHEPAHAGYVGKGIDRKSVV